MILTVSTKEEANINYLKNRGEPGEWFQHKANYIEDKPVPRIRPGGFEIVEKCKPTIGEIIIPNKYEIMKPNDIHIRLTTENARKIADKYNFQQDKWFDFAGNLSYKPPKAPRKLYTKTAEEIAEVNWQQRSHDWFSHNRPKTSVSFNYVNKCIGTEAVQISKKMRSSHMNTCLNNWSVNDKKASVTAPNSPKNRVKFEGIHYSLRARGVGAELLMHSNQYDSDYDDTALPYRCNTEEAAANCRHQVAGSGMAKCMDSTNSVSNKQIELYDRVKSDQAQEYLNRSRSGTMNLSVDGTSVTLKPKVRPEAEEYYNKAQGIVGTIMDQNHCKGYNSPQPVPRIRSEEARHAFEVNKGVMGSFLSKSSYRQAVYKSNNQIRGNIGTEAHENLQKSIGNSMKELVENYKLPPDEPPHHRVGASGWEEGGLKRVASVGNLLNNYGKKTEQIVPPLRLSGAAIEVANKYRSKDFFKTIQQQPPSK